MLDLFLRLIDRCIDLAKRRQEIDRSFFTDFVTPVVADFEAAHKDYMESLRKYRHAIQETDELLTPTHPIIDMIREDMLFTGNLRTKLWELGKLADDRLLGRLIKSIVRYMECAESTDPTHGFLTDTDSWYVEGCRNGTANVIRRGFSNGLIEIFSSCVSEDTKKERAVQALDELVGKIQAKYAEVNSEYMNLRGTLLKVR